MKNLLAVLYEKWFVHISVVFSILTLIVLGIFSPINYDEMEHIHAAYLMREGLIPFKDFWQLHAPLLWIMLKPLLAIAPETTTFFFYSRLFCAFLIVLLFGIVWRMTKELWQEKVRFSFVLMFYLATFSSAQFLSIRPDQLMSLAAFLSIYLAILGGRKERVKYFFLSGVSLALGLSFSHKLIFLTLAVPLASAILYKNSISKIARICFVYTGGIIAGCVPLGVYLFAHDLAGDFYRWVIVYHAEPRGLLLQITWMRHASVTMIVSLAACAGGLYTLRKRWPEPAVVIIAVSFAIIFLSALFLYPIDFWARYYFVPLFLFGAILCPWVIRKIERIAGLWPRILTVTVLMMLVNYSNAAELGEWPLKQSERKKQALLIDWLIENTENQPVLCGIPRHPVFAHNATQLYLGWQFEYLKKETHHKKSMLIEYFAGQKNFAGQIIDKNPSIISRELLHALTEHFLEAGLLTEKDVKRILDFARKNYVWKYHPEHSFFIRRDLPGA